MSAGSAAGGRLTVISVATASSLTGQPATVTHYTMNLINSLYSIHRVDIIRSMSPSAPGLRPEPPRDDALYHSRKAAWYNILWLDKAGERYTPAIRFAASAIV